MATLWATAILAGVKTMVKSVARFAEINLAAIVFRAAIGDGIHGLFVAGQHALAKFFKISWAMNAEDVRQLKFVSVGRICLMLLAILSLLKFEMLTSPP
jgi:hypothetical protein